MRPKPDRANGEDEAPLAVDAPEIPPLIVQRDALVFTSGKQSVTIPLSALINLGDHAAIPLLLYGLLIQLRDVNASLRRGIELTEAAKIAIDANRAGVGNVVGDVIEQMRKAGMELPTPPKPPSSG